MKLSVAVERWPIAGTFTIARGSKTEALVVVATLNDGTFQGRGECVPYARYNETVEGVAHALEAMQELVARGINRQELQHLMPAGAARNALDCAFWDIEAKKAGIAVWEMAGLAPPKPLVTAYTLSLDTPSAMGAAAKKNAHRPLLKIKLGAEGDRERLAAIRAAAPDSALIIDANEGWTAQNLEENLTACKHAGVSLIEQPLPAANDDLLRTIVRPVPVCADESLHAIASLPGLAGKYDAINIKLDKAGGLTQALALRRAAEEAGLAIMVGCMLGTSLGMAPAVLLAQTASIVDLDGPLLLTQDRENGLVYDNQGVHPPLPALWG